MDANTLTYIAASSIVALLVGFGAGLYGPAAIFMVILSILAILLVFIINYADFLLFPLFTHLLRIKIIPTKDYYIPPTNDCVIKYVNGLYYAVGYLTANIYNYVFNIEKVEEGMEEALAEAPNTWERIVQNIKFPFKYHFITYAEDIQKYRDELEAKRGMLEFQLSKEMESQNPSQLTIEDLQRRINIIQARIDRLSSGERPINAIMYIETEAVGVSEKDARDQLTSQLDHLTTLFGGFDVSITRIVGRELYLLFKYGYFLPDITTLNQVFSIQK